MQTTAETYKAQLLSDAYWTPVQQVIQLLEPVVKLLRLADGDTPTTGKLHYYAHKVIHAADGMGSRVAKIVGCLHCQLHSCHKLLAKCASCAANRAAGGYASWCIHDVLA